MSQIFSTFPPRFPQGYDPGLAVALHEPEIPLNVGSVARTCACTNIPLHLVGALGFRLDSRLARRGGLDYWEHADVHIHKTWDEFDTAMKDRRILLLSTKGQKTFWEMDYARGDVLVFGCERTGLPDSLLQCRSESVLTIPMVEGMRSLNVSNAVAVVVYEALRQIVSTASGNH
jgi:tRNA (cytidine/uridine-2'-O-)-methyltransferase